MPKHSYDILRTNVVGQPIWIEGVADLDAAKARILHLAERFPGDYVVFHPATANIVANFHFKPNEFRSLIHVAEDILSG